MSSVLVNHKVWCNEVKNSCFELCFSKLCLFLGCSFLGCSFLGCFFQVLEVDTLAKSRCDGRVEALLACVTEKE